ncbi:hypothetical protein L202_08444 [Cryptococcus amylolentus CBS 6039]|uniref:Thioesterase domain-containing protein n=2 Tax=Cryptococcus amylolentus TaxID=104669 RepID=A0A1E3H9N7_9TREE|nr:hypothetical protein L202_08444 [Cryptococcus amylolentus CBS 6039]ODN73049.1 hypothetical protein L202_08444 [Cryptococcus amylolentus CBS 6039]ODN98204.1 hypothetical protein I350_07850 [Cryptococcus amylolentus CBS 6273]
MPAPTEEQQQTFQRISTHCGFAPSLAPAIRILEMDDIPEQDEKGIRKVDGWRMSYEGVVTDEMTNLIGSIHGAAVVWLVDTLSSAAMIYLHTPTFWGPPMIGGVSLSIHTEYLSPAKLGSKFVVTVDIVKCSKSVASLRCEIRDMKTGRVVAIATHTKMWKPVPASKAKL